MTEASVLLVSGLLLLVARVPVGFAIGAASVLALLPSMSPEPALMTVAQRIAISFDSFVLLAIPLFVLAGELMNRGGLARRLIELARRGVGGVSGGLLQVHIVASMLFGAIAGSAVATASAVGGVLQPRLREEGYAPGVGAAVNVASATTGLVIPPSNVLIVYSLASGGVSIAALFLAGYGPGLLMGASLMAVAAWLARRGRFAPDREAADPPAAGRVLSALPSLSIPVIVMGGIVGGVFTATEAAAVAVLLSLVLGLAYREIRLRDLPAILRDSAATTGSVLLLIGTSMALSWVIAYGRIPQEVASALLSFAHDPLWVLLLLNVTLLAVGTFMDMTPAILIFTPIFLPVATGLGIDPVHFGIVMVMNLCIGVCTPPVGTVLFVGCSVAGVTLGQAVRPLLPLYGAMLVTLAVVTLAPDISLALPRWLGFVP